jgi:uncharacterized protein YggE
MKINTTLIAIGAALVLAGNAEADTELKGNPTELASYLAALPQIVSIVGESEVKVPADKAEVTLKVSTDSKSLVEALRLNQEARGKLAAFLKENGVGSDQIQGAKFSSTQKYGVFSEKAKSHRVDNFLKIQVRDEKQFQAVGSAVDKWAEVHFLGIDVQHSNKETLKAKAQADALVKAGERRKMYEQNLGVKLVAKRFQESATSPYVNEQQSYYGLRYNSSSRLQKSTLGVQGGSEPTTTDEAGSPFGELTFTARVVVDYAVEGK